MLGTKTLADCLSSIPALCLAVAQQAFKVHRYRSISGPQCAEESATISGTVLYSCLYTATDGYLPWSKAEGSLSEFAIRMAHMQGAKLWAELLQRVESQMLKENAMERLL